MMRRLATVCMALLALISGASVVGCGQDQGATAKERAAQRQAAAKHAQRARRRAAVEKAQREQAACEQLVGHFIDTLAGLDSRLDIGLNYDEYTSRVGDTKAAYDRIDFADLRSHLGCLTTVGLPAEKALNDYAKAAAIWDKCFADINCQNDDITDNLRKRWAKASSSIEAAKRGLSRLGKPVAT